MKTRHCGEVANKISLLKVLIREKGEKSGKREKQPKKSGREKQPKKLGREKQPKKLGRREKNREKIGRKEIKLPVPLPCLHWSW